MGKISVSTASIKIEQRPSLYLKAEEFLKEYDFFVLKMNSDELLKIAKFTSRSDSKFGVQRSHKEDRDRQIGQFIASEHPFFPNTVIINFPIEYKESFYSSETGMLRVDIAFKSAYVIDGQHRLKAFASKYSNACNLDLVVAAYFNLELPTIAEIFTRINFFQKPVSKSLVYDLLDFNKDPLFQQYKEAHEIISILNDKVGSPFYGLIKILGVGPGLLSQAAAVEALTTRYKILPMLTEKYDFDKKLEIVEKYFQGVKNAHPSKWGYKDSILSRSLGFNALSKTMSNLIEDNVSGDLIAFNYDDYLSALSKIDVDSVEIRALGGFKGVNALAKIFSESISESAK